MFSQNLLSFRPEQPDDYHLARNGSELSSWKLTNPGIQPATNLLFNLVLINAVAFLVTAWVISRRYHRRRRPQPHLENFPESFAVVPALVPVVALQQLRLQASHLGLVFTSMGIGSLLGATLILPYARAKASPNTLTILAGVIRAGSKSRQSRRNSRWCRPDSGCRQSA